MRLLAGDDFRRGSYSLSYQWIGLLALDWNPILVQEHE